MRKTKTFLSLSIVAAVFILILLLFNPLHAQQYGWVKISQPSTQDFYSVEFTDPLHGWAGNADHGIYRTKDGGVTWTRAVVDFSIDAISMKDSLQGWAIGNFRQGGGPLFMERFFIQQTAVRVGLSSYLYATENLMIVASSLLQKQLLLVCSEL